jgi:hypothetical protein
MSLTGSIVTVDPSEEELDELVSMVVSYEVVGVASSVVVLCQVEVSDHIELD